MLHINDKEVRKLLLQGNFGMEKEGLRVNHDGFMSHRPHPFSQDDSHITRDFCENQTEINTTVFGSAEEVVNDLYHHTCRIISKLTEIDEYLWPFSNPPYIEDEADIPIAQFSGKEVDKTIYREHLSNRYGRYKMTFSGIHFNYSFAGNLLRRNYWVETGTEIKKGEETSDYQEYANRLYLDLAERLVSYGWIMVVLTAASPVMDNSYFEIGRHGQDIFNGMGSVRCSEIGYWNTFVPILNYDSIQDYAASIERYVNKGFIRQPSELYYPIRLKPRGAYNMQNLGNHGVNHIELRMIDLNPLCKEGIDVRDVQFAQYLLVWLASTPLEKFQPIDQVTAIANFKNAAHYNLHSVKIAYPDGNYLSVAETTLQVLGQMELFYNQLGKSDALSNIAYQRLKITQSHDYRYTHIVKREFGNNFVKKGIELCANYSALAAAKESK
ncbi:MAG: hypothetical protein Q4B58_03585 [Bacteroidales bacterium]|nr:hypothetical protein [Bacteroidales bacterium]